MKYSICMNTNLFDSVSCHKLILIVDTENIPKWTNIENYIYNLYNCKISYTNNFNNLIFNQNTNISTIAKNPLFLLSHCLKNIAYVNRESVDIKHGIVEANQWTERHRWIFH